MVAVHGRLEDPHHPRQRLDRHLDAGAEAPRARRAAPGRRPSRPRLPTGPAAAESAPVACGPCPLPRVVAVAPGSPAARAGLAAGRRDLSPSTARRPATSSQYQLLADEAERRARGRAGAASSSPSTVDKRGRRAARRRGRLGACSTRSARATTTASSASSTSCRQGMRPSLYLKDDDYRLSFLYGNFTTLTRFTEADLERVVTERPVAALRQHPRHRPRRARRACCATGAAPPACAGCGRCSTTASRCTARSWCAPASTTAPCSTTRSPACSTATPSWPRVVRRAARREPLSTRGRACGRTPRAEAGGRRRRGRGRGRTCSSPSLGRRLVFAADEYYLLADRPFPAAEAYEGFPMHEDGIGMARTFELEFTRRRPTRADAAPQRRVLRLGRRRAGRRATARRAAPGGTRRRRCGPTPGARRARRSPSSPASTAPRCSRRCSPTLGRDDVRVVAGRQRVLRRQHRGDRPLVGADLAARARRRARRPPLPAARRRACPRAASSTAPTPADLPRPVEVVATDGVALRGALDAARPMAPA